ncbi:MAG: AmmeMemoRadiSam system protein A [Myxococcales bacterium]|jgi:AmmeMemoRadiSam system protein A
MVAVDTQPAPQSPPQALCAIAREAITAYLERRAYRPPPLQPPWQRSRGVFVTLRTLDDALRGCIGHMEPMYESLSEEIAACALSSALRDTRFAPVGREELSGLRIEISLLTPTEPVADVGQLDARRYGVVVNAGGRRGVLLPDIEGVDSVEEQIRIASAKAGIPPGTPLQLERFEVQKVAEPD